MTKLFAISDQHYGHQNIIKYCQRDLSLQESRNIGLTESYVGFENLSASADAKAMILAHNSVVSENDVVIFVGDVQASHQGREWIKKILPKLNGQKILVRGNHDHQTDQEYLDMGFLKVCDFLTIGHFCFHHYPDTPKVVDICQQKQMTLVCGHTHKPFRDYRDGIKRINVCVDVMGREPFFIGYLEQLSNNQQG